MATVSSTLATKWDIMPVSDYALSLGYTTWTLELEEEG